MTAPRWWSQPFAPEGSQAAEGISNQLGRPALDPIEILVREAVQNSWDARAAAGPVRFRLSLEPLGERAEAWRAALDPGPSPDSVAGMSASLRAESRLWVVSDRGTVGLGGPIRAGVRAGENERSDFVQFIRNVGEPRDTDLGGGTYGFGKGIFYRLSRPGVILVSSRAGERPEDRRLMGAAIGTSYYEGDHRFTGRHWWGVVAEDVPDPLLGDEADRLAEQLGLPAFEPGETGTDIVVLGALTGGDSEDAQRSPREAGEYAASAILWHLWPKLCGRAEQRMEFAVEVDGEPVVLPDPSSVPELAPFVEAVITAREGDGTHLTRTVDPKDVGVITIAIDAASADEMPPVVASAMPFQRPLHHVARMRQVELVVDYFEGPLHPNPSLQYAGVFKASTSADGHFATAEPPTHDAWVERGLSGTDRGVVQGARRDLQRLLQSTFETPGIAAATERAGLAALSGRLGTMLDRVSRATPPSGGGGVGGGSGGGGAGGGSSRPGVRVVESTRIVAFGDQVFLVTRARLTSGAQPKVFEAQAAVRLGGGRREDEPPANAPVPRIIQWTPVAGGPAVPGAAIEVAAGHDAEWWIYADLVDQVVVDIVIREK